MLSLLKKEYDSVPFQTWGQYSSEGVNGLSKITERASGKIQGRSFCKPALFKKSE